MRYISLATRIRNASMLAILRFAYFGSVPVLLLRLHAPERLRKLLSFRSEAFEPTPRATESGTLQVLRCRLEATKRTVPTAPSTLQCFRYRNSPRHEISNGPNPDVLLINSYNMRKQEAILRL